MKTIFNLQKIEKLAPFYILSVIAIILVVNSGAIAGFRHHLEIKIPHIDKVGHFFAMGLLTLAINFLLLKQKTIKWPFTIILGSILVFPLVTFEEFSQKYLVYRSFSYYDLAADYLGILIFSMLGYVIISKKMQLESRLETHKEGSETPRKNEIYEN